MRSNLKFFKIAALILFALFLSSCATVYNPATQRNEIILIDTPSEIALGEDLDRQIARELKISLNSPGHERLNLIGEKVASFSDRPNLPYRFRIVDDKDLNAFAVPGGFIYVNKGLVDITSDDELACVLAHEIGHLAARHSVKKMQAAMGYQLLMGIAKASSGKQAIGDAVGIVFNLVNLGYSRKDEFLADKLAVKYARRAGFKPQAMVTFFKKLKQEAQVKGASYNPVFLSSHPPIEERIKRAEEEIGFNY